MVHDKYFMTHPLSLHSFLSLWTLWIEKRVHSQPKFLSLSNIWFNTPKTIVNDLNLPKKSIYSLFYDAEQVKANDNNSQGGAGWWVQACRALLEHSVSTSTPGMPSVPWSRRRYTLVTPQHCWAHSRLGTGEGHSQSYRGMLKHYTNVPTDLSRQLLGWHACKIFLIYREIFHIYKGQWV